MTLQVNEIGRTIKQQIDDVPMEEMELQLPLPERMIVGRRLPREWKRGTKEQRDRDQAIDCSMTNKYVSWQYFAFRNRDSNDNIITHSHNNGNKLKFRMEARCPADYL